MSGMNRVVCGCTMLVLGSPFLAACLAAMAAPALAADHPGLAIYLEHCRRCHGDRGDGTPQVPEPLRGDRSVNQLAAYVADTMPEDDPGRVTGEAARQVAEYLHGAFYSAVARDRNRPARIELSRLTVRQYRSAVADLVGSFRGRPPRVDDGRGLLGEYFEGRSFDRGKSLVFERIDSHVDFDFGVEGPDPERFRPGRFAIRWTGSIVPPESGSYELVVRTAHAARLALNTAAHEPPLVDAFVTSGSGTEHRATIELLGGRAYPLRLEFSKANQGVDEPRHEPLRNASIRLLWKPPHGVLEPVPERCLVPREVPRVFVSGTPFPPDDRSIGYDRGTTISREWYAATTAAAVEVADHVLERVEQLAQVRRDAPDRADKLRLFAARFAERAFRRPLTPDQLDLLVDRPFAAAADLDAALRRSLLLTLGSPRFLYREPRSAGGDGDAFDTAARLSFGLWDSLPDEELWNAAAGGRLGSPAEVRLQAERMVRDRRTRAKVRDFLFAWLRLDLVSEVGKDAADFPGFSPEVAADLRTSLDLFLDDAIWNEGDFRSLFLADEVHLNGRLAALYGADLRPGEPFRRVRLDDGRRGGILSHPYLLSMLAHPRETSPIHRGVFLARSVLGNTLRPPEEAIVPLAPEQAPDLTTRERVTLQTQAVACQGCHALINPLGFALEEFDAIGRYRDREFRGGRSLPIDPRGSYLPREGPPVHFRGVRELAVYLAGSRDAQEAFVQALFHALVKQPLLAWGPDTPQRLRESFTAGGFSVPGLIVDIMTLAALPPQAPSVRPATEETKP